jgi:hypothetical protein
MITKAEERTLIDLLRRHDTPTEIIRKAMDAKQCELHLKYPEHTIIVRDINHKK